LANIGLEPKSSHTIKYSQPHELVLFHIMKLSINCHKGFHYPHLINSYLFNYIKVVGLTTHTGNTRQPEPQLKSSSCSSAILSHNSRGVISNHNSRNTTCLTPIPSHNSRDMFWATTQGTLASRPLRYPRSLVDHAHPSKQKPKSATAISPDAAHGGARAAMRQAPWNPLTLQPSLDRTSTTARHLTFQ